MRTNRRTVIRQLALISAGAALLPSCFHDDAPPTHQWTHFRVDKEQEQLLTELSSTLIPTTDTPGAKEAMASLFVLKMIDDCASADDRSKFFKGMQQFDSAAKTASGKSFVKCDQPGRESLLRDIEAKKLADADLSFFYSTTKRLTILAYSSSQYFLTRVQLYELVPGRWHGCVPVKAPLKSAS